jgi:hypothetical protein
LPDGDDGGDDRGKDETQDDDQRCHAVNRLLSAASAQMAGNRPVNVFVRDFQDQICNDRAAGQ